MNQQTPVRRPPAAAGAAAPPSKRRRLVFGALCLGALWAVVPLMLSTTVTTSSKFRKSGGEVLRGSLEDAMVVVAFVDPGRGLHEGENFEPREARTLLANSWKYSKEAAVNSSAGRRRVDLLLFADVSRKDSNLMNVKGCLTTPIDQIDSLLKTLDREHDKNMGGLCRIIFLDFEPFMAASNSRFNMLVSDNVTKFVSLYGWTMFTEPDTMITPKLFSYTPEVPLVMGHALGGDQDMWNALVRNDRSLAEWLRWDTTYKKWFGHYLGTLGTWVGRTSTVLSAAARVVRVPPTNPFDFKRSVGGLLDLWRYGRPMWEAITSEVPESEIAHSPLLDVPCDSNARNYVHLNCGQYQDTLNPKALVINRVNFRSRRLHQGQVPVTEQDARGTAARYALFIVMRQNYTHRDLFKPPKRMQHSNTLPASASSGEASASSWVGPDAIAIVGYVPANHIVQELHHMLEPSWHFARTNYTPEGFRGHGEPRKRCDLIVVVSPGVTSPPGCKRVNISDGEDAIHKALESPPAASGTEVPGVCLLIDLVLPADNIWMQRDKYMLSLSFVNDPRLRQMFLQYDRVLRTDIDVFVTTRLLLWRPQQHFIVGDGRYVHATYGRTRILEVSKRLGLKHKEMHNLGSTWFVTPEALLLVMPLALEVAEEMHTHEFGRDDVMNWPEWWMGVLSMYSSELAINHLIQPNEIQIERNLLDVESTSFHSYDIFPPHIHCWQTDQPFSKLENRARKYNTSSHPLETLEPNLRIRDYALYMVLYYSTSGASGDRQFGR